MITGIVAVSQNGTIGLSGRIPWHCKEDLRHFKETTLNNTLIMGRKTFEGLPKKLEGRNIVVLSKIKTGIEDGVVFVNTVQGALEEAKKFNTEIFIAGGAEVYSTFSLYIDRWLITRIQSEAIGDTFFNINLFKFKQVGEKKLSKTVSCFEYLRE